MDLKTSFCSIAFRGNPNLSGLDIIPQVADEGYNGIELWWPHLNLLADGAFPEAVEAAEDAGLAVPMVSPYLGNFNLDMTNRGEMLDRARAAAPVAASLGAPLVRAFAGWTCECSSLNASDEYWEYNLEGFRDMAQIADGHGIDIAIETHSGTLADSVEGFLRFVDFCGPRIKANLQLDDIALNSGLPDGATVYRALKDHVAHVHVPFPLEAGRREDYAVLLGALRDDGYEGFVSVEHCAASVAPQKAMREGLAMLRELGA